MLGGALGIAALFLYLGTTQSNTTGATFTILFGSIFVIQASTIPVFVLLGLSALAMVGLLYRPLLLSSVSTDIASARGVPVRAVGLGYLLSMAIAVALSSVTIGAILSTAMLIGPAASALRLARRPGSAMVWAAVIGVAVTWLGILLAYDSYYWPPAGRGWPVSFFVVTLVFGFYLLAGLASRRTVRRRGKQLGVWHDNPATSVRDDGTVRPSPGAR